MTNTNNNITHRLEAIENQIKKGEKIRIQSETMIEQLMHQYNQVDSELIALGVDPKNAEQVLKELESEIEKKMSEIESMLPTNIINHYKQETINSEASPF